MPWLACGSSRCSRRTDSAPPHLPTATAAVKFPARYEERCNAEAPHTQLMLCFIMSRFDPQLEEAQKKHDLLLELVRKDQEHSKRLVMVRLQMLLLLLVTAHKNTRCVL